MRTFFLRAGTPEFPESLHGRIMSRIRMVAVRKARIQAIVSSGTAFVSGAALVPAFGYAMQVFAHSGFFQYFSLAFSDGGTVLSLWQDFAVLLGETFPFAQAALFFALVVVCLVSVRAAFRSVPLALGRTVLAH